MNKPNHNLVSKTDMAGRPLTMQEIAENAKMRSLALLLDARNAMTIADKALKEAASTPLIANGVGKALKTAAEDSQQLGENLSRLMTEVDSYFRPDTEVKVRALPEEQDQL
jgi:hypothetical protein